MGYLKFTVGLIGGYDTCHCVINNHKSMKLHFTYEERGMGACIFMIACVCLCV